MESLGRIATLVKLNLQNTSVTDAGIARLTGLTKLRSLVLTGTKIGDGALESIGRLAALERLEAGFTALTDAAVAAFGAAHPGVAIGR
jgi:hypothetical protein